MDTRLLRMFCVVAESGSLVVASARLHLTNSALSHGIKSLEAQLGCRLFERVARKLILNQAGEQLLSAVQAPLAALDAASASLKQLGKWGQTRLRLGAAASICQHLLPVVVRELKKTYAHLELQVETGDTPELIEALRGAKIDLAVGIAPETQAGLQVRPLFRDELMFGFAPVHPWAAGRPISREELRTQSFILYNRSSFTTRLVHDFFRNLEVVPHAVLQVGNLEAIKEMVKLNLGVGILAPWIAEKDLASGALRLRPLANKPLTRRWAVLSLPTRRLNLAEEDLCRLCRRHATALRLDRKDVPASGR